MITETKPRETLWTVPIGVYWLTWTTIDNWWVDLYQFVARIPLFVTGNDISFKLKSTSGTRILHKCRIDVQGEAIDVFWYNNIV
jgi:hypothetical protein